jgi:plasmid maintenance system antidote protein VapI
MKSEMSPARYKALVQKLGTQPEVGRMVGVERECISKRCNGKQVITVEAALAITHLVEKKENAPAKTKSAKDLF